MAKFRLNSACYWPSLSPVLRIRPALGLYCSIEKTGKSERVPDSPIGLLVIRLFKLTAAWKKGETIFLLQLSLAKKKVLT